MANKPALLAALNSAFGAKGQDHWIETLSAAGVPTSRVNTIDRMFDEPQVKHRQTLVELDHPKLGRIRTFANPIRYSSTPARYDRPPPALGADTRAVLTDLLGLSDGDLTSLAAKKVI
jgi:crotonobetainyl-CoA:carnitine CoA-transferase CaiB-like acyl-CoA transferase